MSTKHDPANPDTIPETIGPYMIVKELGRGAMGVVLLAQHQQLRREVALKVLPVGTGGEPQLLIRFKREAEAAMRLSHPSLVRVYDFGESDGLCYFAMEYVKGRLLSDVLTQRGALPCPEALRLTRELLEGLLVFHDAGMIHRDIKPANLMIDEQHHIRVLDLGLVKQLDRTALTREGSLIGSPRYMPPEVIQGGEGDARGDIYQVGLILYECLAGKPAFADTAMVTLLPRIAKEPPPPLPPLDGAGSRLVPAFLERTLAKRPADRFPGCREALSHLAQHATARSPTLPPAHGIGGRHGAHSGPTLRVAVLPDLRTGSSLRRRVSLGAVVASLVALVSLWMGAPRVPLPPAVSFGDAGWEVRWQTQEPLRGRVEVCPGPNELWTTVAEDTAPRTDHVVRFRSWPSPGGRLRFRVSTGTASPGSEQWLQVTGSGSPLDISCRPGPTEIMFEWHTLAAVEQVLSVDGSPLTTRDGAPCQSHRLTLSGLSPGTTANLSLRTPAGNEIASWTHRTVSMDEVAIEAVRVLSWAGTTILHVKAASGGAQLAPTRRERAGQRWRKAFEEWSGREDVRRALASYRQIRSRIRGSIDLPASTRAALLRGLEDLRDLERLLMEGFGLPLDLAGWHGDQGADAALPRGLKPFLALYFADVGTPRPLILEGVKPVLVPPPAVFNVEARPEILGPAGVRLGGGLVETVAGEAKAFFRSNLEEPAAAGLVDAVSDRAKDVLSSTRETAARFELHLPGPLVPVGRSGPGLAYLTYRASGGTSTEKIVVRAGREDLGREAPVLAILRVSGQPQDGCVQIDGRLLADPEARLSLYHEHRSLRPMAKGITLGHLVFHGR